MHFTEQAHQIGVDGFLVVTPYYSKPPPRGIVEHFKAIASMSDKPVVVYNIPGRVVINIEPETMAKLAEIETVKAVKQANDDLHQARFIVEETGLDLYAGDDNLVYPFLERRRHRRRLRAHARRRPAGEGDDPLYKAGDHVEARRMDEELAAAYDLLKVVTNPIAIKAALNLLGHEVGGLRLPLVEATEDEIEQVRALPRPPRPARPGLALAVSVPPEGRVSAPPRTRAFPPGSSASVSTPCSRSPALGELVDAALPQPHRAHDDAAR